VLYFIRQLPTLIQGLIFGGALGNIFDRFFHQGVLDFIDLHIYNWHYPAFNLADSFIVIAIIYIIINEIKLDYTEKKVIKNITK
jgi:signal peptidase II